MNNGLCKEVDIVGVIPARYHSTRLPGKPLLKIGSKSMIERVYNQCIQAKTLDRIIIATDDLRIVEEVKSFGGNVVLTDIDLPTGTDRVHQAIKKSFPTARIVVNIQGDEPLIDPQIIDLCVDKLLTSAPEVVCTTPVKIITNQEEITSPNTVKVLFDKSGKALYFSRSPIPYQGNVIAGFNYYKHIGLYAYRADFLEEFVKMESGTIELTESLEQLRILDNGKEIGCCVVNYEAIGVDTEEDLEKVRKILTD